MPSDQPCFSLKAASTRSADLCLIPSPHRWASSKFPQSLLAAFLALNKKSTNLESDVTPEIDTNKIYFTSHPSGIPDSILSQNPPDLSITPPESPLRPRLGAKESSSSKKMMHGAAALALANTEKKARRRVVLRSLKSGEKDGK